MNYHQVETSRENLFLLVIPLSSCSVYIYNIYIYIYIYIYININIYITIMLFQFYLSIFLFIYQVSSKEIKLLLFDSCFQLTLCNQKTKKTNTGNIQCDIVIIVRQYRQAHSIFSLEHFCIINISSNLICTKIIILKKSQTCGHLSPQKF